MTLKMLAYLFVSGFYIYLAFFGEKKIEWMDGAAAIKWRSLQTENVVGLIAWKAMNLVLVQSQTRFWMLVYLIVLGELELDEQ